MNYGDFKSFTLGLINQYTARGMELTESYNDQADYLQRIPGLYNAAMLELASEAAHIVGVMTPNKSDVTDMNNGFVRVKVPADFIRMTGDGIPVVRDGRMTRTKAYYAVGNGAVLIRKDLYTKGILEYYRSPVRLPADPSGIDDDQELDGTEEMQIAAAYYTAAMLVLQDDAFAYSALRNEYDDKLTMMKRRMHAETFYVDEDCAVGYDVY